MTIDIKSIQTLADEAEYQLALTAVRHYPIPRAKPVDVLKAVMAANNYTRADLIDILGSKARAADLLNGRREINLDQIRKISRAWRIPPGSLIGDVAA